MKKQDEQEWVNKVMNSLEGMQSAEPGVFLYAKIRDRVTGGSTKALLRRTISVSRVIIVAASLALLLLLNLFTVYRQDKQKMPEASMQQVAGYYQLTNDNSLGL